MSRVPSAGFIALLLPIFLSAGACSADDGLPKLYPSPKAVFDAYREACARRDWRACFPLLSREGQDDAVFEAYFSLMMDPQDEQSYAVLKRYGVDETTLTRDLKREYKAKHGVEPADDKALLDFLEKEYKAKHGVDAPESRDTWSRELDLWYRDIWTDVLWRHIKDKAGFYAAAVNLALEKYPDPPLGDLEQVAVQNDTATGRVAFPSFHYETPPGKKTRKVEDTIYKTFYFRKVNRGWLLDSL